MFKVELKELILLYITLSGFVSYVPQIVKIIKNKSSEDVSISSWVIFSMNSVAYLVYLILDRVNIWLMLSQLLEVTLIVTTLITVLIFKKRKS